MTLSNSDTIRAVVRGAHGVSLARVPTPRVTRADDVVIEMAVAGVCRTDLFVADGRVPCVTPRVLGHEVSGIVVGVGDATASLGTPNGIACGDAVTVMPWIGCGDVERCAACRDRRPWRCARAQMLGVDLDGAFAERMVVPARAVHRLPDGLSLVAGAYAEPVAAAMAVRHARISKTERVLVVGRGRIAELTQRVLAADGVTDITIVDPAMCDATTHDATTQTWRTTLAPGSFDVAIETVPRADVLDALLDAVRPGGTLVLKSRPAERVSIDLARAVRREIRMIAVGYAPMEDALAMLASGRLREGELFAEPAPLDAFDDVFAAARESESKKHFLTTRVTPRAELA